MREEHIPKPPETPLELPKPTRKSSRKKFYAGILVVIVAVVVALSFASLYLYSKQVATGVIIQVWSTWSLKSHEITGMSLSPPSANATFTLLIRNPSDYIVTISTDLDIYLGNGASSQQIGKLKIDSLNLPANSTKTIDFNVHLDSSALSILQSIEKTFRMKGLVEGSVTYTFFTFYRTLGVDGTTTF